MNGFQRILVATDFGESSAAAVDMAIDLATKFDAELTVAHVYEPPVPYDSGFGYPAPMFADLGDMAAQELAKELARVKARYPRAVSMLRTGVAWEGTLAAAQQQRADLIVLGTHGRRGISRALLGSVAEKVVRLSPVAVLTVHGVAPSIPKAAAGEKR
ncbi:MAG TPA: universal stress protein [Byssovorax sp.]|jgi:nucleotide-binding universal stress UspA family protein